MIIGSQIYRTKVCNNSMDWAKQNIKTAQDGAVFFADEYLHTRGRQGRVWNRYPGQLLATLLLKPDLSCFDSETLPIRLNRLNMALAMGIYEPLKEYGIGLKWPNDFVADEKKVGGMLVEIVWVGDVPKGIVLGFALNVNNSFSESDKLFKIATSLHDLTKIEIGISKLQESIFCCIDAWYKKWLDGKFEEVFATWKSNQLCLGKTIKLHKKDGQVVSGVMAGIELNGDLKLSVDVNNEITIPFYIVEQVKLL